MEYKKMSLSEVLQDLKKSLQKPELQMNRIVLMMILFPGNFSESTMQYGS
jgi:hypothetical protein